jgi:predicted nucleic acid-binding protein
VAGYVVVLDANVLYGIEVTDFFATMATRRLFRPHWSPEILDEVARNLALRPDLDAAAIDRRLENLNRALPGALTAVPLELMTTMPVNDKDRHVLALAVHVGAPTIVTENLRDFPTAMLEPFGVEAVSADAFGLAQVDLHPGAVRASIAAMAARRVRHPRTVVEIAETLARYLPDAMAALDRRSGQD